MPWYMLPLTAVNYIVPDKSALREPKLAVYFAISIAILHTAYHVLANTLFRGADPKKLKQRCWILTTINGGVMTLVSLPYLWDLLSSGFDLHAVQPRTEWLAVPMACFFVAYLLSDLGLGSIYYRHLINLSSGWIHHSVYTILFAYWLHKGWVHIAVMACVFELPTFIMGIASLHPPFRSNTAFTATFFLTRVFFHFGLLIAACTEHGRMTPGIDGSIGPAVSIAATYPMHLWWGYKCIMSVRRRMHKRKLEARKSRESGMFNGSAAASYFNSAAQLFNGLPDPNTASALNTPATTPGSSPLLAAADKRSASLHAAFQRAAAFASEPSRMVLGRSRKNSEVSDISIGESSVSNGKVQGNNLISSATDKQFFSNAVRPLGAGPDDREPFLAIRSPAEARDRARRLVADAIRKAWASAPESWRQQFEAEMEANDINTRSLARRSSAESTSGEETDGDGLTAVEKKTRTQRGKDAARRAFFRAIHRAINGKEDTTPDVEVVGEGEDAVQVIPEEDKELAKNDRRILQTILKFSGIQLPPDLIGQEYIVREFPVAREDGRGKRLVGQIRRRMEINRRDVVVFD